MGWVVDGRGWVEGVHMAILVSSTPMLDIAPEEHTTTLRHAQLNALAIEQDDIQPSRVA